jgi:adenine-specific DNA methylase
VKPFTGIVAGSSYFPGISTGAIAMPQETPHNWWTRKNLVLAASVVALAFAGLITIGVTHPEPAASAALGPEWHCSRLAFVFTTCSRVKQSRVMAVRLAKIPVCGRLRT